MIVYLVPLGVFVLLFFLYMWVDTPSSPSGAVKAPAQDEAAGPPPPTWQRLLKEVGAALAFIGIGIVAFFGLIILVCAAG